MRARHELLEAELHRGECASVRVPMKRHRDRNRTQHTPAGAMRTPLAITTVATGARVGVGALLVALGSVFCRVLAGQVGMRRRTAASRARRRRRHSRPKPEQDEERETEQSEQPRHGRDGQHTARPPRAKPRIPKRTQTRGFSRSGAPAWAAQPAAATAHSCPTDPVCAPTDAAIDSSAVRAAASCRTRAPARSCLASIPKRV